MSLRTLHAITVAALQPLPGLGMLPSPVSILTDVLSMGMNNPGPSQVAHNGEDFCLDVSGMPSSAPASVGPPKKKNPRLIQEGYATTLEKKTKQLEGVLVAGEFLG